MLHTLRKITQNTKQNPAIYAQQLPAHFILLRSITWITFIFILVTACNTTEPPPIIPPPKPEVKDTLIISIAGKTYRSITVSVITTNNSANSGTGKEIKLLRKKEGGLDTLVSKYSNAVLDTTIIDDSNGNGLQLNTTYTYYAVRTDSNGTAKDSSNYITAQTLAATSHNYTWEEKIIGDDGYSNALYDVWGTDENNVYAVGGFTINDTTYGAIHWNGVEWKPQKGASGYAIFGFSENDIWSAGGRVTHYDGNNWDPVDAKVVNGQAVILDQVLFDNREYTSIWGTSSNNLYLGNLWGRIVHWDGSKAELMDVQASSSFRDIYGIDENTIYAAVGNNNGQRTGELYSFENGRWKLIKKASSSPAEDELIAPLNSVWLQNNYELYIANGGGVGRRRNNSWEQIDVGFYSERIRGNASNNIFVTGDFGNVTHFNGEEWYHYSELQRDSDILNGVLVFAKTVFIVGLRVGQGFGFKSIILKGILN